MKKIKPEFTKISHETNEKNYAFITVAMTEIRILMYNAETLEYGIIDGGVYTYGIFKTDESQYLKRQSELMTQTYEYQLRKIIKSCKEIRKSQ